MEQLNRVTIRGRVHNIKRTDVNGNEHSLLSVVTEFIYKERENGQVVIETTYHNIVAWNIDKEIQKGDAVEVVGRIRNVKYTDDKDNERYTYEIYAKDITKIDVDSIIKNEE